jgi:hypothetical protein
MEYDVCNLLASLFGGVVPTAAAVKQPVALPKAMQQPNLIERPTAAPMPDADEMPDFESLPQPGRPCPRCGSLESWQNALGRQRCSVCGRAALEKALRLAEKAAELRIANPPKPQNVAP